jgi:hypothetical protein
MANKIYEVTFTEEGSDRQTTSQGIMANAPDNADDAWVERRYRQLHQRQNIVKFTVQGETTDADVARALGDVTAGRVPTGVKPGVAGNVPAPQPVTTSAGPGVSNTGGNR